MLFEYTYAIASYLSRTTKAGRNIKATLMPSRNPFRSLSLSLSVPGEGSQWCPVHSHYHPRNPSSFPGRVLLCLTLQGLILCAPGFALPPSVYSSSLPVIDRCFARVNTMYSSPRREAQDRPQTPITRAYIWSTLKAFIKSVRMSNKK